MKGAIKMKIKQRSNALFCAGFIVVFFVWLIVYTSELSAISLLKTALLIALSYIAMVLDIKTKRIPNILVLIMITGWLILILPMLFYDTNNGLKLLVDSLYGLLLGGGLFLLVYLLSRKGLGGGDVKFMAAAGLYLGFAGTIPAILYGTVLAALTGLILILFKKIGRKDTMPLAPFLFAGIMITLFTY